MTNNSPPGNAVNTTPVVCDAGTPADESLFFEIYDFDVVPPSLVSTGQFDAAPDVVSVKIEGIQRA